MCALFLLKIELKYAHDFNILVHNILVIVFFFLVAVSFLKLINLFIFSSILITWRLNTLHYCSGFLPYIDMTLRKMSTLQHA